jgi:hypothetical protein
MNDIEPGKDGRLDDVVQSYLELRILEMMEYGHGALRQFPTSEKYTLAADIKRLMDQMLEHSVEISAKYYKKTTLQKLDVDNKKLKLYLRLSMKLGYLPFKKYDVWTDKCREIGRIIGGFIRSTDV